MRQFLSGLKTAGVGRKTLKGKGLAKRYSVFKELLVTAFAGAIMNEFEMRRKVRCHKEAVDFFWSERVLSLDSAGTVGPEFLALSTNIWKPANSFTIPQPGDAGYDGGHLNPIGSGLLSRPTLARHL